MEVIVAIVTSGDETIDIRSCIDVIYSSDIGLMMLVQSQFCRNSAIAYNAARRVSS